MPLKLWKFAGNIVKRNGLGGLKVEHQPMLQRESCALYCSLTQGANQTKNPVALALSSSVVAENMQIKTVAWRHGR